MKKILVILFSLSLVACSQGKQEDITYIFLEPIESQQNIGDDLLSYETIFAFVSNKEFSEVNITKVGNIDYFSTEIKDINEVSFSYRDEAFEGFVYIILVYHEAEQLSLAPFEYQLVEVTFDQETYMFHLDEAVIVNRRNTLSDDGFEISFVYEVVEVNPGSFSAAITYRVLAEETIEIHGFEIFNNNFLSYRITGNMYKRFETYPNLALTGGTLNVFPVTETQQLVRTFGFTIVYGQQNQNVSYYMVSYDKQHITERVYVNQFIKGQSII